MSYTRGLWHIVFSTKHRQRTLEARYRRDFLAYLNGTLKGIGCFVLRINAVEDHVHILANVPPDLTISRLVGETKTNTGRWLRDSGRFPHFTYWQEKYAAFTVSWGDRLRVIEYIKNQEEHHRRVDFMSEFRAMLEENGMHYDERDEETAPDSRA